MEKKLNNNTNGGRQDSQFCRTLMNITGAIGHLSGQSDCAIVLCSDGKSVSSRQHGLYPDALNMVLVKMLNDDKFAELVLEAAMLYSRRMKGNDNVDNYDDEDGQQQDGGMRQPA